MDSLLGSLGMGAALPRLDCSLPDAFTNVWCMFLHSLISSTCTLVSILSSVADCQTITSRFFCYLRRFHLSTEDFVYLYI